MPADTSTTTAADSAPAQAAPDLRIQVAPGASMPTRAHTDDAGLDLASAEDLEIPPGGRALVDTGLAVALPPGTVGMVCPRSGLAAKHGITVLNGPGIVDAGYRGPVKVALHNTDPIESFTLQRGDRIAQLDGRSEEHTSELQSRGHLVCRLLLEKKKDGIIQVIL